MYLKIDAEFTVVYSEECGKNEQKIFLFIKVIRIFFKVHISFQKIKFL